MSILYIIATPIGNLDDISQRALTILQELEVLACEDTRHTRIIFDRFQIPLPAKIFSYNNFNEFSAGNKILKCLSNGESVGLVSNAGYPGISDPGYRIISSAIGEGYTVDVIPGPSAVPIALLLSGLPTSSFTFKGFSPKKSGKRMSFMQLDSDMPHTLLFFESGQRLHDFLTDAYTVYGNRKAAVCIELTKKFQRVERGFLQELIERFVNQSVKGEITVVIAGNNAKFTIESSLEPLE